MEQQINSLLNSIEVHGQAATRQLDSDEYTSRIAEIKKELTSFQKGVKQIIKDVDDITNMAQQESIDRKKSVKLLSSDESKIIELEKEVNRLEEEIKLKIDQLESQSTAKLTHEITDGDLATLRAEVMQLELLEATYLQATNLVAAENGTYIRLNPPLLINADTVSWKEVWQL